MYELRIISHWVGTCELFLLIPTHKGWGHRAETLREQIKLHHSFACFYVKGTLMHKR